MNASKLFSIIILLMFFLIAFGIIIKVTFSMLAEASKAWFFFMYEKYCKLAKASWHLFGVSNEPN